MNYICFAFDKVNRTEKQRELLGITHAYGHRLADVHLAGFAPAFTLSFHDSECSRKPPVPIASVVMRHSKKKTELQLKILDELSALGTKTDLQFKY